MLFRITMFGSTEAAALIYVEAPEGTGKEQLVEAAQKLVDADDGLPWEDDRGHHLRGCTITPEPVLAANVKKETEDFDADYEYRDGALVRKEG
jgi:hypothetical protein